MYAIGKQHKANAESMIVVFTVHHVYNTFLIFAKCEQETSNGSLTVYHQTFLPLLPWNFLPLRRGGGRGGDCDYLQLLWSNNFCNVLWSLQPSAGNKCGLNLQMHMIKKKKNLGVKTNWHQSPIDGFIVFVLVCDCENLLHLCLLLAFHSTRKFGY